MTTLNPIFERFSFYLKSESFVTGREENKREKLQVRRDMFPYLAANPQQVDDDNGGLHPTTSLTKGRGDGRGLGLHLMQNHILHIIN